MFERFFLKNRKLDDIVDFPRWQDIVVKQASTDKSFSVGLYGAEDKRGGQVLDTRGPHADIEILSGATSWYHSVFPKEHLTFDALDEDALKRYDKVGGVFMTFLYDRSMCARLIYTDRFVDSSPGSHSAFTLIVPPNVTVPPDNKLPPINALPKGPVAGYFYEVLRNTRAMIRIFEAVYPEFALRGETIIRADPAFRTVDMMKELEKMTNPENDPRETSKFVVKGMSPKDTRQTEQYASLPAPADKNVTQRLSKKQEPAASPTNQHSFNSPVERLLKTENKELRERKGALEATIRGHEETLAQEQSQRAELGTALRGYEETLAQEQSHRARLENDVEGLRAKLGSLTKMIDSAVKAKLDSERGRYDDLIAKNKALERRSIELEARETIRKIHIDGINEGRAKELESMRDECARKVVDETARVQAQERGASSGLRERIDEIESDLRVQRAESESFKLKFDLREKLLGKLERAFMGDPKLYATLQRYRSEVRLEEAKSRASQREGEAEDAKRRAESLEQTLGVKDATYSAERSKTLNTLEELRAYAAELETAFRSYKVEQETRFKRQSELINDKDSMLDVLQEEIGATRRDYDHVVAKYKEITDLLPEESEDQSDVATDG